MLSFYYFRQAGKGQQRFDCQVYEYLGWNWTLDPLLDGNMWELKMPKSDSKTVEQKYIYLKKPEAPCLPAALRCHREAAPLCFK